MTLEIKGFIETSLLDWDGKIVSVIFVPDCNFRCGFCHNMQLLTHPENYKTVSEQHIFDYLDSHKEFTDGVCITGGEPTLYKDQGLTEFIKKVKEMGFLIKLDTNGSDPEYIEKLIKEKLVDHIAMDIKAPINKYDLATNAKVDAKKIKRAIDMLISKKMSCEFRTTVVPTIVNIEDIEDIAKMIKGAENYYLQQFEPDHCEDVELRKQKPYPVETVAIMLELARKYVKNVHYRGK
jgi:pyruvate formate lyase activating enzyme